MGLTVEVKLFVFVFGRTLQEHVGRNEFIPLDATQLHQMTGRAGRRGMDNIGFAVAVPGKFMDVHLMIVDPDRYLEAYRDAGADWLTVHYETCTHLHRTIQKISELGMKPSVSVNPHTDVSLLEPILGDLNMVLVMTVNPGFGGQQFIEGSWDKIRKLKNMILDAGTDTLIQIDGGVTEANIGYLIRAGVDVFVVGNTIFSADDPLQVTSNLKNAS